MGTALLRIWQILKENSDADHPLTQKDIADQLDRYGISMERKAIGRNITALKDMGADIESTHEGSYLASRDFEDSELRLLIDGVLCSKYITAKHSSDLIKRLCGLSNKYFSSHMNNICYVNDRDRGDNQELFFNIEQADSAVSDRKKLEFDYYKLGVDKKPHKTSHHVVSPFQLMLNNQRYYLQAYSEKYGHVAYFRLDRIKNTNILDEKAMNIRSVKGYENGISYRKSTLSMPYMYSDEPELIKMTADVSVIDQIFDWLGNNIKIVENKDDETKITIFLKASPTAMKYWALQYLSHVEILSPESLRNEIRESLEKGVEKYR